MKKMSESLKNNRGDALIETLGGLLAIMMVIVMLLAVLPVFIAKQDLNELADRAMRTAEVTGQIGQETNQTIRQLTEEMGITPSVSWETRYVSGQRDQRIQLNEEIKVTVEDTIDIGFGGIGSFPVRIRSTALGRSEVYWKT